MLKVIVLGGPVMIPLLLCSVLALAISIDRLWYLIRSRVDSEDPWRISASPSNREKCWKPCRLPSGPGDQLQQS